MRRSKSGKTQHPIKEGDNPDEPDILLDGSKAEAFTDAVKKIGTVRNVEDFWTMYDFVSLIHEYAVSMYCIDDILMFL